MIHKALSFSLDVIALERELNAITNVTNNNHFNNTTIHSFINKKTTKVSFGNHNMQLLNFLSKTEQDAKKT